MKVSYLEVEKSSLSDCLDYINGIIDAENIISIETSERTDEVFGYDEYDSGTEYRITVKVFYKTKEE